MLDLRQLRYFVAVAETEHVGRAAEQLHISQSPLSRQIAQLEKNLGLTLFERSQQRIRLTSDGRGLPDRGHAPCCATPTGWRTSAGDSAAAKRAACASATSPTPCTRVSSRCPAPPARGTSRYSRRAVRPGVRLGAVRGLRQRSLDIALVRNHRPRTILACRQRPLLEDPLLLVASGAAIRSRGRTRVTARGPRRAAMDRDRGRRGDPGLAGHVRRFVCGLRLHPRHPARRCRAPHRTGPCRLRPRPRAGPEEHGARHDRRRRGT